MDGWIKLYRQTLENPIVCKDGDHLAVWIYLLLNATHSSYDAMFKGERIVLNPGQLITGRKSIAGKLSISESKVQRILKLFENEHQIEQQSSNRNRLISILNWHKFQHVEQQNEQQVNNKRTTGEQQVNTNKNVRTKELKELYLLLPTDNGEKKSFGNHISLTDLEYEILLGEFGEEDAKKRIKVEGITKSISGNNIGTDFEKIMMRAGRKKGD